jgi:hypothetical protein
MHLRGHGNIIKRMLIHVAGFNLSILLRRVLGAGTPRELGSVSAAFSKLIAAVGRRLKWIALGLWSLTPIFVRHGRFAYAPREPVRKRNKPLSPRAASVVSHIHTNVYCFGVSFFVKEEDGYAKSGEYYVDPGRTDHAD